QSKEWLATRQRIIGDRLVNGETICEYCHKPIYKKYDIILHHKIELTLDNYQDVSISLNPGNIMIVHHKCHNLIHNNLHQGPNKVYIVYGSPLSGKSSFVNDQAQYGDLIIDIDRVWECITGLSHLDGKPDGLKRNVFAIRDLLYDQVKKKVGYYNNCYIVGGFALRGERERLAKELNAELIYIDTEKEVCLDRAKDIANKEVSKAYKEYIDKWFANNNL
ncbi:MAG: HNH endonuclease, partial [Lachnospiraceae bacterium]|nr:HNH endonuclease [Lachnospiraceae bacterium]